MSTVVDPNRSGGYRAATSPTPRHSVRVVARHVGAVALRDGRSVGARAWSLVGVVALVVVLGIVDGLGDSARDADPRTVGVTAADVTHPVMAPLGSGFGPANARSLTTPGGASSDLARIRPVVVDNPAGAVAEGTVEAGVVLEAGRILLLVDPGDEDSRDAGDRLLVAVGAAAGSDVTVVDIAPGRTVRDLGAARRIVFGLAFGLQFALTAPLGTFTSGSGAMVLQPLLVLPLRRRHLMLGLAAGFAPVTIAAMLLVGAALALVSVAPLPGFGMAFDTLTTTAVGLAAAGVALGLIGAAAVAFVAATSAGRDSAALAGMSIAPLLLGGFVAAQRIADTPRLFELLPVVSSMSLVGDAVLGTVEPTLVAASTVSALVGAAAFLRLAGHRLHRDTPDRT